MSKATELRKKLLKRKSELVNSENPEWKTSGEFRPNYFSERNGINVKAASKTELLSAYKSIKNHAECATDLGFSTDHLGYPTEDWITDFKTRASVLERNENLRKVKELEDELRPLLTPKELRAIGISDLEDRIADL